MKVFLIFFPSVALVHKPRRLMGFLLILKESFVYHVVAFDF